MVTGLFDHITVSGVMAFIYFMDFVISLFIIFFDKKTPTATLAWIMLLNLLPIVGLVLYLVFSQHISRLKVSKMSENETMMKHFVLDIQKEQIRHGFVHYSNEITNRWKNMILLNLQYADSLLLGSRSIDLICDGKEMFEKLIRDIENAKSSVNVCYFIVKDDFVGRKLIDTLTAKAKEGVEVRLLMDAMGSKQITRHKLKDFKAAGGKYAFYFEPRIRHMFLRFNYRNHRKIVTIDDTVGYIGGFNIAREYLGFKRKFGYWRDEHLRIEGNLVIDLVSRFYIDWRYAYDDTTDLSELITIDNPESDYENAIPGQIVSSGPDELKEQIKRAFMKMISCAEKSIYIQTPYLVPDLSVIDSLEMAAQSGVDVRIMIPCMPDHPFVYHTTLYNASILMEAGARVYIYENGFLHAKTMVVDGEVSTVGSANFDIRSFKLNFETNAFIYDKDFARKMEEQFEKDILKSREYTFAERESRGVYNKMMERISRLLSEIL